MSPNRLYSALKKGKRDKNLHLPELLTLVRSKHRACGFLNIAGTHQSGRKKKKAEAFAGQPL